MARVFESKAVRSVKQSESIRTTVPEAISALLGLEIGDSILWEVEPGSGRISVSRKGPAKSSKRS